MKEAELRALAFMELEMRRVAAHPYYAIKRGYVFTEDEKRGGDKRPMPDLPYLEILCDLFMKYPLGIMLKSRQMMASWLFCWIILWTAKYKSGSLSLMQGKRLDDVKAIGTKSLMGRLMFLYRNLPEFLKTPDERAAVSATRREKKQNAALKASETLTSLVIPGGGVCIAAPQGPDIIRSKTATTVCMDELPHHPEGPEAWTAALPTVDGADQRYSEARLWGVGTPNGRDPLCYEMAPWEKWRSWKELTGFRYDDGSPVEGLRVYLKQRVYEGFKLSPICCVRLHYTAEYDPEMWARRRATREAYPTPGAYERENEISFRSVAGMAVYGEESFGAAHSGAWEPDPNRPVVVSMDLGHQGTAACIWQMESVPVRDIVLYRHRLFWSKLWKACYLEDVLNELKGLLGKWSFDWSTARWITDWNSLNTHHGGAGITDFQIFQRAGIYPEARPVGPHQVNQGIELVRRALKKLPDGLPGLIVDPNAAADVMEMFDGGYRYEEPTPGKSYTETPLKDGVYDHLADAVRYRFWADPYSIFENEEPLPADEPRHGTTRYVKRYLKKRTSRDNEPVDGIGPGGMGAT
jgi:hypothetical protein